MAPRRPTQPSGWAQAVVYAFAAFFAVSTVLLLLPTQLAKKLPKPLRSLRNTLLGYWRRSRELSADGPFYKLFVWAGRKVGRGKLASAPQVPLTKAKPHGCNEVEVTLHPRLPWNPFHEENYVVSWCVAADDPPTWRSREFNAEHDCEKAGKGFKTVIDGLPDASALKVRAAAVNRRGQSGWSKEVAVETLARPGDDGGFTGPAGRGAGRKVQYSWTQTPAEVHVRLPLGPAPKARDIRLKCTGLRLEVHLSEEAAGAGKPTELLCGPLFRRVKPDETFWTVEEDPKVGRHLQIQMVKAEGLTKWECLIEADGHPRIDTQYVRFWTGDGLTGLGGLGDLSNLR